MYLLLKKNLKINKGLILIKIFIYFHNYSISNKNGNGKRYYFK